MKLFTNAAALVAASLALVACESIQGAPSGRNDVRYLEQSYRDDGFREELVSFYSGDWILRGDWLYPVGEKHYGAVLMLNQVEGDRKVYKKLAEEFADLGIASLRLDLRGHGESTSLGKFGPPYTESAWLLGEADRDIAAALDWLVKKEEIGAYQVAVIGASYSGEEMAEAWRNGSLRPAAFVMLSPGNFTSESIYTVDQTGMPWLFVRTEEETAASRDLVSRVFANLGRESATAEQWIVNGEGHATDILNRHQDLSPRIAGWVDEKLKQRKEEMAALGFVID